MAPMKTKWHAEGGRLRGAWFESRAQSYNPAWMQSVYPREASAQRSSSNRSSLLSPFGKTRYQTASALSTR